MKMILLSIPVMIFIGFTPGISAAAPAGYPAVITTTSPFVNLPRPDDEKNDGIPRLGEGPAITVMDRSFIADRRLVDLLVNTAEAEEVPYQYKRPGIGGTDGGAVHVTREGVPTGAVSIPARYIHSPAAVLDLADFWHTVELMQATLKRLPEQEW